MITAAFLGACLSLDSCTACSLVRKEVHLCETHATEERSVFARENRRLKSKDEAERIAGLDALAALTMGHTNAPSERVVDQIALALDDDSYLVRKHATELLGRPQNAESVLATLSKALCKAEDERKRLSDEEEKIRKKGRDPKLATKKRDELEQELSACTKMAEVVFGWRSTILDQLAAIPDDRVVAVICAQVPRDLVAGGNEALVRLGSHAALRAVVESMEAWDQKLGEIKKKIADPMADGNQVTALGMTQWELEYQKTRMAGEIVFIKLSRMFLERQIQTPAPLEGKHEAWRDWVEQHPELFPEHLPGVGSPAW